MEEPRDSGGQVSDANTGHASDASAELSELETAGPWRKAFDALRASLWIRRPRPVVETDADFPWPRDAMAAYAQLRRTQAPPRCPLDAVVVVAALPRVERDDGAAMRARLGARTGRTSVPSVWIGERYVGGLNDGLGEEAPGLAPLEKRGELDGLLREVAAIV